MKENIELSQKLDQLQNLRNIISFIFKLWYQYHTDFVEMTHKMWTSFKTLASKKVTVWLKKSQSNNKLLYNSSSHTE